MSGKACQTRRSLSSLGVFEVLRALHTFVWRSLVHSNLLSIFLLSHVEVAAAVTMSTIPASPDEAPCESSTPSRHHFEIRGEALTFEYTRNDTLMADPNLQIITLAAALEGNKERHQMSGTDRETPAMQTWWNRSSSPGKWQPKLHSLKRLLVSASISSHFRNSDFNISGRYRLSSASFSGPG